MGLRTRVFLLCFVPIALLLAGSFWAIQTVVQAAVRDGIRSSLRDNHFVVSRLQSQTDLQNDRFLRIVGENAALKAGIQLVISNPRDAAAKQTLEDQLREFCQQMHFDFLMVSDSRGAPLAGVLRRGNNVEPIDAQAGLSLKQERAHDGSPYRVASVPLDQAEENIGEISVGERFHLSELASPSVLIGGGKVLESTVPGISLQELQAALNFCNGVTECEFRLRGETYLSLPLDGFSFRGYSLRSLQSVDAAGGPVQSVLNRVFLAALLGAVAATLIFGVFLARSIVKPIATIVSHLKESERTGLFTEFALDVSSIREIRDLTSSFNRAARATRETHRRLKDAYVEFVGSLAHALDARDKYTAGHSSRVSHLACATAKALGIAAEEIEEIRMGALLHDIGKIGIADKVLQKPGKLTEDEFDVIKQHPAIGRRILEGVNGFLPYLDAVELHHENWDGTGYPRGQSAEETPIAARIIHVVDAFDAMTTDRPYRSGMSREKALDILFEFAGRQFDPRVVEAFTRLAVHAPDSSPVPLELVGVQ